MWMPSPSCKLTENNHTNIKFCHQYHAFHFILIPLHAIVCLEIAFTAINTKVTK
ncbi:hypothetical protein Plhal304r1_c058g0145121 [Plasmopara halstedii]